MVDNCKKTMTLPAKIKLQPIQPAYQYIKINQAIAELNQLIWTTLEGGSSWYRLGGDSYTFDVQYWVHKNTLSVREIKGELRDEKYQMNFVVGTEVLLPLRKYLFSSHPEYGHFSTTADSPYLTAGSAYYQELATYDEPLAKRDQDASRNKKWLMTTEKESEAATFILELCRVIKERKAQDD
jgi:hypothetical protein